MGFSAPRIGQALAAAVAGDTVLVGPGDHAEEVRTVRPGRPGAPISGSSGGRAPTWSGPVAAARAGWSRSCTTT